MPLDDIARRYANTLFVDKMEKQAQGFQQVSAETRAALLKRGLTEHNSGQYHSEMARVGINYIADLAQAKADSLVSAYERAAIPFDDDAVGEVSREVVEYCEAQGINLARNLEENARRAGMHSGVGSQVASTIAASVSGIEARLRRQLSARRDEQILDSRKRPESVGAERSEWDVFISHASEDKEFVRPLADALIARGLRVWYDEFELKVGDHLRRSIDRGLVRSRYGIVVLSPAFFAKHWPQTEVICFFSTRSRALCN